VCAAPGSTIEVSDEAEADLAREGNINLLLMHGGHLKVTRGRKQFSGRIQVVDEPKVYVH
jgi:hypothetical protein